MNPSGSLLSSLDGSFSGIRVAFTTDEQRLAVLGEGVCPMLLDAQGESGSREDCPPGPHTT